MEQIKIIPYSDDNFEDNLALLNLEILKSPNMARKKLISRAEMHNFLDFMLKQPDSIYLLAIFQENVIGNIYTLPRMEDLLSHIGLLSYQVHPQFQRQGIASLLINSLLQKIQSPDNKISILYAEVLKRNTASINFLKKFSFSQAGILPDGVKFSAQQSDDLLFFYRKVK